jgi:hypothetical protein
VNILRAIALFALVLTLSACGTSITETAELEIQILTSLADIQSIDRLVVTSDAGSVLYSATSFANRFHTLELEMGKTYQINAEASVSDHGPSGTVSLSTEVTLVAAAQSVVLDLRRMRIPWFEGTEEQSSVFVAIKENLSGGSVAPDLHFVGGSYTSHAALPIEAVFVHFGRNTLEWSEGSVTLTPEMFGEANLLGSAMLEIQYPGIPSTHCTFNIGVFNLSWEDESSRLDQRLEVSIPCRG